MKDFTQLVDLASERLGGSVLLANDEFFAPKESLLKATKPIFIEGKYTARGKWMDGWETRRRREPGHDWCIIRLGLPGIVRGFVVDTSYFKGNFPEHCSIEACSAPSLLAPRQEIKQLTGPGNPWAELLGKTKLEGNTLNPFPIEDSHRFTHVRLNIYPDGGVARLRVYGEVVPDWRQIVGQEMEIDLAAVKHGGRVIAASDEFFGAPQNLLMPAKGKNMGDGWETRRRRKPGHDWAVIQLGIAGKIRRVEVDTSHFKGNFPESCSVEACAAEDESRERFPNAALPWEAILPRQRLRGHSRHSFENEIRDAGPVTHIRFNIFPDGGVSRLRIHGTPSPGGKAREGLRWLNSLTEKDAEAAFMECCGSSRWARQMLEARPFSSMAHLFQAVESICTELTEQDWLEAFRHHPPIGGKKEAAASSARARRWSKQEQLGARNAPAKTLNALVAANRAYQARFGYVFIVCATGKSAEEMLALAQRRLANDPGAEIRVAAEEQCQITRLRLEKLLGL